MHNRSIAALFGSINIMVLTTTAHAQETASTAEGHETLETVVVSATRIQTNGYTQPTPVTVASVAELLQTTPSNIPDALNKLPQFAGSTTNVGNGNGAGSGPSNLFTGNYLNLRNLGAIRTLILLDGRRVPSTAGNGSVDTNTLPQALVQRVDVVTAGASAVYGSDAVTGVVNFVLDTRYSGLKLQVQKGLSDHGDAPSFKAGIVGGTDVFDRGHVIFSAEHYQNDGVERIEDRDYTSPIYVYTGAGTDVDPYRLTANARISTTAYGGLVTSGPFANQQFVGSGALAPFNPGTATRTSGISSGGDGAYLYDAVVGAPLKSDQLFGRFEYQLHDDAIAFAQLNWTESGNYNYKRVNQPNIAMTIYSGNAFLPSSAQTALTQAGTASFVMNRYPRDISLGSSLDQTVTSLSFTTGLKGKLFNTYNWEAYYTYGEAKVLSRRNNNINLPNFYAAVDAVKDSSGTIVCRVTLTNPGLYPGCQPINMFGERNQSPQALDYIYDDTSFHVRNRMDDYAASISGDVLQGWAGPVSAALNYEYRQQSITQTSSADPSQALNLTGVRLGTAPRSVYVYDLLGPQSGANSVWEVGGEAVLPLLRDMAVVKRLDVSGAVRYTEYSSSGAATTWKAGLNYEPTEDLRFRYTESRDIRAPTLTDLYSGQTVAGVTVNDQLHSGKTGNASLLGGGNPNLVPEVSRTTTVGAVYRPFWIPRFQMSVDYFNIDMKNAITTLAGNNADILRECENSGGTSPLCTLIVRPLPFSDRSTANFPTAVRSTNLNVASLFTHGIDVEASYNFDLAGIASSLPGRLDLRLLYTYQPVLKSRSYDSSPLVDAAGVVGLSAHRGSILVGYLAGPLSVNWLARYSGKLALSGNPLVVYAEPDLPSRIVHDLNIAYRFEAAGHDLQASITVGNLFDKAPRISPSPSLTGSPGSASGLVDGDDIVGRYFTLGLKAQF